MGPEAESTEMEQESTPPRPATSNTTQPPVYRMSFFIVLPAFAAYAALFTLQHQVKVMYGIKDNASEASHDFSLATSMLYIFNLIFRVMHNVVFGCAMSRTRVYIALGTLMTAMLILTLVTASLLAPRMPYVMLAYALGGIGVGSFESNLLSTLTFLGHGTKKYATSAIPIGIFLLQTGAFTMLGCGLPVHLIYALVIVALFYGMAALCFGIPVQEEGLPAAPLASQRGLQLQHDLRAWRHWLPRMWSLPLAMVVDMFCLSAFAPGVLLFVYNKPEVVLLRPPLVSGVVAISRDIFFVMYNFCAATGGITGRIGAYHVRQLVHPLGFTAFSVVGVTLVVLGFPGHALGACGPLVAFPAVMLIFLGDGLIYNTIGRSIDEYVPRGYNLAAISCWLFWGDLGSVTGSNLIPYIRDWVS